MKASVLTMTYNHEKYIARAIESALMQETDFAFEIIIGDDLSTDGTRAIIERFQSAHPEKIRALPTEQHLGMPRNYGRIYRAARGEYLAALDGDDYWTTPTKLQRQVDFLERHPDCSLCFTNATIVCEDGSQPDRPYCPADLKEFSGFEDILAEQFVPTCTAVYRASQPPDPSLRLPRLLMLDWPLIIASSLLGKLGYINEITAVYTKHADGTWTGATVDEKIRSIAEMYDAIDEKTGFKHQALIRALKMRWYEHFRRLYVTHQLREREQMHRENADKWAAQRDEASRGFQTSIQALRQENAALRQEAVAAERAKVTEQFQKRIQALSQEVDRAKVVKDEQRQRLAQVQAERSETVQRLQARLQALAQDNAALRMDVETLGRQLPLDPPLALSPVSSRATGYLGSKGETRHLHGWAWDPAEPDRAVAVSLYEGSVPLGTVLADLPRPDLAERALGNGKHGFTLPLPASLRDGKPHTIRAQIAGANIELRNSPQIHVFPAPEINAVNGPTEAVPLQVCPNPIFVLGCPRSGTHALAHSLARHSQLWTQGESAVLYALFANDRFTSAFQVQQNFLLPTWVREYGVAKPEFLRALGLGINALFTSKNPGKRWIDKTPDYTLIAPTLADMFPGALFLHLVRDGRRVVHSMAHFLDRFSAEQQAIFRATMPAKHWATDFREACKTWHQFVEAGSRFCAQNPARCLTVTNEQLVAEPQRTFSEICRFVGVPFEEGPVNLFSQVRIYSSFRSDEAQKTRFVEQMPYRDTEPWKEWTAEQRRIFVDEAGDVLINWGFVGREELDTWAFACPPTEVADPVLD